MRLILLAHIQIQCQFISIMTPWPLFQNQDKWKYNGPMNSATMSGIGGLSMQQPPQLQHAQQTIKPPMQQMLNPSMQIQNQQHPSPHQHMQCQCRGTNNGMPCQCRPNAGMQCQQQQQQQPMVYMGGQHHLNVIPPQNQFLSAPRNSSAVSIVYCLRIFYS